MRQIAVIAASALLALAVAAKAQAAGGDAKQQAQEVFNNRCSACHGAQGKGDGVASKSLTPAPRNFVDTAWQKTVSDDYIEKIIREGGASVGKSPLMPPNPDLNAQPQVVTELRLVVRAFGK